MSNVFDKTTYGDYTFTLGVDNITDGGDTSGNGSVTSEHSTDPHPCFIISNKQNLSTKTKHDTFCRIKNLYLSVKI
ncbi:hypothetical protein [Epilithonimonas mollis]|uniref:hypothetical protein n=1 Tax=Epilithonimonas mollis TaxID=216903 RepID=UPI0011149B98|nr:hypothetical protein [Epilithonimonas mollis]